MSAHRHQRRHDHDQDHHGRRHPQREEAGAAEDNSAVIAQMGPAVQGPAPAAEAGGPLVDMPDWAADIGEEEQAAPAAAWGGTGAALALAPTPEAPAVEEGATGAGLAEVGAASGGVAPAEGQSQLDAIIPPGMGFSVGGHVKLTALLGLQPGACVKVLNDGSGLLEVTCTEELAGEIDTGLGGEIADSGAEVGAKVGANLGSERVYRIPWAQLIDASVLAAMALSPLPDVLEQMLTGQDLQPYLMKAEDTAGISLGGEAGAGVKVGGLGAALSGEAAGGVTIGVEYDDLATDGVRTGTYSIGGSGECVAGALLDLRPIGIHFDLDPSLSVGVSVQVPFVETNGVETYGTPYVRMEGAGGMDANGNELAAGCSVETGPDHQVIEAHASIGKGVDLWNDVLGGTVAVAVGSIVDTEVSGKMTLGLEVDLSGIFNAGVSIAQDAALWLTTGETTPEIADALPELQALVAKTAPTLGVELELLSLGGELGVSGKAGVEVGAEAGGAAKILYERDDVFPELGVKPTLPNILGYLRGAAPTAA